MANWFVDHVIPALLSAIALTLPMWIGYRLFRHLTREIAEQTGHSDEALTHIAAQADALAAGLAAARSEVGDARIAAETAAEAMKLLTSVLSPKAAGKPPKGKAGE